MTDGSPDPRAALRWSTACGLVPMALGSLGFFGWLISTGGIGSEGKPFIMLGIAALGGGPVLFVIGLGALAVARRRGAPARPLVRRALLLFANLPLAALYFLGLKVAAIQRVEADRLARRNGLDARRGARRGEGRSGGCRGEGETKGEERGSRARLLTSSYHQG